MNSCTMTLARRLLPVDSCPSTLARRLLPPSARNQPEPKLWCNTRQEYLLLLWNQGSIYEDFCSVGCIGIGHQEIIVLKYGE